MRLAPPSEPPTLAAFAALLAEAEGQDHGEALRWLIGTSPAGSALLEILQQAAADAGLPSGSFRFLEDAAASRQALDRLLLASERWDPARGLETVFSAEDLEWLDLGQLLAMARARARRGEGDAGRLARLCTLLEASNPDEPSPREGAADSPGPVSAVPPAEIEVPAVSLDKPSRTSPRVS